MSEKQKIWIYNNLLNDYDTYTSNDLRNIADEMDRLRYDRMTVSIMNNEVVCQVSRLENDSEYESRINAEEITKTQKEHYEKAQYENLKKKYGNS